MFAPVYRLPRAWSQSYLACSVPNGVRSLTLPHSPPPLPSSLSSPPSPFPHHHPTPAVLFDLARQHGAGARKLFTWAQGDGGPSEEPAPDGGVGYYWLNAERRLLRWDDPDPEFVQLNETLWGMADEAGGGGAAGAAGRYGESIGTHLRSAGTSPRMMALADAGYANTAGFELDDISLGHTIDCERHWNTHDGEHDYRSKTSKVAAAMSDGLRIQTCAVVEAVVYGRGDVQLHLRGEGGRAAAAEGSKGGGGNEDGGGGASGPANAVVHARRVVVAVPVSVLSAGDIAFSPPLPLPKVSAAAAIRLSPGCKVVLKFRRRFWPADCHGIICADSFMPEMWMDTVRGIGKDVHAAAADGAADGAVDGAVDRAADDAQGGRGGGGVPLRDHLCHGCLRHASMLDAARGGRGHHPAAARRHVLQ